MPFSVSFSVVNNRKPLGHRPVDPCLSPGCPWDTRCPTDFYYPLFLHSVVDWKTVMLYNRRAVTLSPIMPRPSDAPQWTKFASRRQGFTPTLRLVQNPVFGRASPSVCMVQTSYFVSKISLFCVVLGPHATKWRVGLQNPYFAQTVSFVEGSGGSWHFCGKHMCGVTAFR